MDTPEPAKLRVNVNLSSLVGKAIGEAAENFSKELMKNIKVRLPKSYIINENAGILFWQDGDKTVVKRTADDKPNKRIAFLTAYFQKMSGLSKNQANKFSDSLKTVEEKAKK